MMRSLIKITALVLVLGSSAWAQFGLSYETFDFDIVGGGARAEGMGKAYLGVSDDITGGGWNPAGIYEFEKPVIGVTWGSLSPRGTTDATSITNFTELSHSGSLSAISSLNFVAPIRIKGHPFVGSFNYTRNFDTFEEASWEYDGPFTINPVEGYYYDVDGSVDAVSQLDGGLYSVNFALSTRLYDKISAGVSLNVYTGQFVRELRADTVLYDVLYNFDQHGTATINGTARDTNKFSGYNLTVGFKYNGERTGLGLVIRTPFTLKVNTDSSFFLITYFNGLPINSGTDTTFVGDMVTKYDMPLDIAAGISYNLTENLMLAGDIEYRGFSGSKISVRDSILINPGGNNIEYFTEIDPEWNNVLTLRMGGEYLWHKSFGTVPFRAGFGYVPSPIPELDVNGVESTPVTYNLAMGTGIHWSQIKFDLAYTYSSNSRGYYEPGFIADTKNRNHHFGFTFTGVF